MQTHGRHTRNPNITKGYQSCASGLTVRCRYHASMLSHELTSTEPPSFHLVSALDKAVSVAVSTLPVRCQDGVSRLEFNDPYALRTTGCGVNRPVTQLFCRDLRFHTDISYCYVDFQITVMQ
jgi:hypothetical protein